jgi:hypothetical protein
MTASDFWEHSYVAKWQKDRLLYLYARTRWFKYDRDKLWLIYTQIVPVIFEPPCIYCVNVANLCFVNIHHTLSSGMRIWTAHAVIMLIYQQTSDRF